jgi:hypothetical protein
MAAAGSARTCACVAWERAPPVAKMSASGAAYGGNVDGDDAARY